MSTFLIVVSVLLGLSSLGKLTWIYSGNFPERETVSEAIDVLINAALIIWAIYLLN